MYWKTIWQKMDNQLLNSFLKSFCSNFFNQSSKLSIEQQTVPGEFHSTDDENERKGLPDAVIYAEEQCAKRGSAKQSGNEL